MSTASTGKNGIWMALLIFFIFIAGGCSTWQAKTQSIVSQASTGLETAKAAGAEKYAPEIIKSADQYMLLAKQALGDGKYQDAQRYAEKAMADAALAEVQASNGGRSDEINSLREQIASLMQ